MSYIELCLTRFDQLHEENLKYTVLVFFMLADPVLQADNDTAWRTDDGQIPHIRSKLQIIIWFFFLQKTQWLNVPFMQYVFLTATVAVEWCLCTQTMKW